MNYILQIEFFLLFSSSLPRGRFNSTPRTYFKVDPSQLKEFNISRGPGVSKQQDSLCHEKIM